MRRSLNGYGLPSDSDFNAEDVLQRINSSPRTPSTVSAALPPSWMATAAAVAAATAPAAGIDQQRLGASARGENASRTAATSDRLPVQEIAFGRLGRVATTEEPWIWNGKKSSPSSAFISTNNVHKNLAATANQLKKRGIGHILSPNMTEADTKKKSSSKRQRKTPSPGGSSSRSINNNSSNNNDMMERLASMSGGFPMPKKWAAAFNSNNQKQQQQQQKKKKSDSTSDLFTWRNEAKFSLKGDRDDQRRSVAVTVPLSIGAFPMPRLATTTPGTNMVGPDSFQCFQKIWDDAAEKVNNNGQRETINDDIAFVQDLQKVVLQRQLRQQLG